MGKVSDLTGEADGEGTRPDWGGRQGGSQLIGEAGGEGQGKCIVF